MTAEVVSFGVENYVEEAPRLGAEVRAEKPRLHLVAPLGEIAVSAQELPISERDLGPLPTPRAEAPWDGRVF